MTATLEAPQATLPRAMNLRDLVLFNVVAVLSLRWFATAAAAGPSSLTLWVLAALFFFIPQGLAVSDMAARFPEEGGIYFWTKRAFGEGHGFLCGWCYWVNNILYYPNLLMSTAVVGTYVIGRGDTALAGDWVYVLPATLLALWIAVALNIVGLRTGRWLQNLGAVGSYLPGVLLVALGAYAAFNRPAATPLTLESITPNLGDWSALNLWASIAFAFAGLELCAVMGAEIKDPRSTLPRSIYISAPLIAFLYIAGTAAVLWLVPTGEVNIVSGFLQALAVGAANVGTGLAWVAPMAAAFYVVGNVGGVGAWLTGPARVAFVIGLDRYFPPAFGRIHPRWQTPYVAILVQAILATVFLLLSVLGRGTTVERAYLVILDTMLLVYFIPYIYLFVCYLVIRLKERVPASSAVGGRVAGGLIGVSGLALTLFAMVIATVPPSDAEDAWLHPVKVIGGAGLFVLLGGLIYWRGRR
ncbi:MAG: amino acid permease [Gemmatimonadales bacterium]|nr:amino acid permease [Gemmatimonadales bacterium]MDQ3427698.1 APC family permease [Gemmatimonadota bacterium]